MLGRVLGLDGFVGIITKAELKAFIHTIVMPLLFTYFFNNVLMGLGWILLLTVIYCVVHKNKKEEARVFFKMLSVVGLILLLISAIIFIFIIG